MHNTGKTQDSIDVPQWAAMIKERRLALGENQAAFGKRWEVTQATVSYWEMGLSDPPAAVIWWLTHEEQSDEA